MPARKSLSRLCLCAPFITTLGLRAPEQSHAAETTPTVVPVDHFRTADPRLQVTLWAASPMLRNPTNIDFDKEGRMWVAEAVNYRMHYDRQPAGDRIVVLQDTNNDGRADKSTVFVQEPFLRAPLGIAVVDNKIYVSMTPDLVVYTDVDRNQRFDPKIDKREVLLTGFNGRIHDHSLHSLTVGPDGELYFSAGNAGAVVTGTDGKTFRMGSPYHPYYGARPAGDLGWDPMKIAGEKSDDGHVYIGGFSARMKPDGSRIHVLGHNFRNSFEQSINGFGDVFHADNDDSQSCRTSFLMEGANAGFSSLDGQRGRSQDTRPGQDVPTSHWHQEDPGSMPVGDLYGSGSPTGMVTLETSALGKKYEGMMLSGEPGRNVVFGYFPKEKGAGFDLKHFDFVTSNPSKAFAGADFKGGDKGVNDDLKTYFRPSDVTVGPDGAVYIADFFDPRVGGHNDMDKTLSGAIYRVAPRGFKSRIPKIDLTTLKGAMAGFVSPAPHVRGAAFGALQAMGHKALDPIVKLLGHRNPSVQARALWLLSQMGDAGLGRVRPFVNHKNPKRRLVAFRALRRNIEDGWAKGMGPKAGCENPLVVLALGAADDRSPALRREAALAMRSLPYGDARPVLLKLVQTLDVNDPYALEALGLGATHKEAALYADLAKSIGDTDPLQWSQTFARLAWRLHPPQSVEGFVIRAGAERLTEKQRTDALTAIGFNPTRQAAEAMVAIAKESKDAINATALWWLMNRKDNTWKAFGVKRVLKESGVYDEDKITLTEMKVPAPQTPTLTVEDVVALKGDIKRGKMVAGACATCHRVEDRGVGYGPSLTDWAHRQGRTVLATAIVSPSADIAHGYGGEAILTREGIEIHGRVLSDGDPLVIQSQGGITQMVPKKRIKQRRSLGRSLMFSAEEFGFDAQSVADVISYLMSLR